MLGTRIQMIKLLPLNKTDHFEKMLKWRNDERIFKWCRQNDFINETSHSKWFDKQALDPTIKMYAINYQGDFVGVCGLTDIDLINQRAEFSLYVDPDRHQKGIGKKALIELLRIGFARYPLYSIWGESFEGNLACVMFNKIGFKYDGMIRNHYFRKGNFISAHIYSITRNEFYALHNTSAANIYIDSKFCADEFNNNKIKRFCGWE